MRARPRPNTVRYGNCLSNAMPQSFNPLTPWPQSLNPLTVTPHFAVLTVFWLFSTFLTVFDDWYTVVSVLVDLWRLVHQWFWVFWRLVQCTVRQKQSKDSQAAKNDHWCTNRHMSTQSPPNTQSRYLARPPSHVPGQWSQPVARGQGWLYVSTDLTRIKRRGLWCQT